MSEIKECITCTRILIPVVILGFLIIECFASAASDLDILNDLNAIEYDTSAEREGRLIEDRLEKVKAKWKGELLKLESEKGRESSSALIFVTTPPPQNVGTELQFYHETSSPPPGFRSMIKHKKSKKSKKSKSSFTSRSKKNREKKHPKVTKIPKYIPRTALNSYEGNTTKNTHSVKNGFLSEYMKNSTTIDSFYVTTTTTPGYTRPLRTKSTKAPKPKPSKRPSKTPSKTKITGGKNHNRTTITPLVKNKNGTSGNDSQIQIQFYPNNPVNLLYLLQNMQQSTAPSIIKGGVPVKVLQSNSPFQFSFDLESFSTRLAISLFYAVISIAPLFFILLGMNGLGSLTGLSIVPFGRKKRKKRSVVSHYEFENLMDSLDLDFDVVGY